MVTAPQERDPEASPFRGEQEIPRVVSGDPEHEDEALRWTEGGEPL